MFWSWGYNDTVQSAVFSPVFSTLKHIKMPKSQMTVSCSDRKTHLKSVSIFNSSSFKKLHSTESAPELIWVNNYSDSLLDGPHTQTHWQRTLRTSLTHLTTALICCLVRNDHTKILDSLCSGCVSSLWQRPEFTSSPLLYLTVKLTICSPLKIHLQAPASIAVC